VPQFIVPYGNASIDLKLPDGIQCSEMTGRVMPELPNLTQKLREQLDSPLGTRPLKELARGRGSAMLVVGDPTHYNAYEVWLPKVLQELNEAGIPDARISLYIATVTQGALSDDVKLRTFGEEVMRRVTLLDHDCDAHERMEKVGRTRNGTVLEIDKRVLNSDLLILIGGVQYHHFSGYTGGPKSIIPGCASRDSILQNSKYAVDPKTGDIHRWVGPGMIVGNPVSEDMHQCMSVVKPDMCINVVINGERKVSAIHAGDPALVLRMCAKVLDDHCQVPTLPANIVIIGAGGSPRDSTLFQAYKALRHSLGVLAPDASVVMLAKCDKGEGGADMAIHRGWTTDEIRDEMRRDPAPMTFCSLMLRKLAQRYDIHLVSELPGDVVDGWRFTPHRDLNDALATVVRKRGYNQNWAVGTDMSFLLAVRPGSNLREGRE
jgi:nickel-dependent lactate racemase